MRPAIEVFVEELAMALCAASGGQWRTNEGLSAWAVVNLNPDGLNNHWRYKAKALLPVIEADRLALVEEIVAELEALAAWNEQHDDGLSGLDKMAQGQREAIEEIRAKFGGGSNE